MALQVLVVLMILACYIYDMGGRTLLSYFNPVAMFIGLVLMIGAWVRVRDSLPTQLAAQKKMQKCITVFLSFLTLAITPFNPQYIFSQEQ